MAEPAIALFFAASAGGVLLAAIVLSAAPSRAVNRALALYLGILSANYAADAAHGLVADDGLSWQLLYLTMVTWHLSPVAYCAFVGLALDTPLARPLRHPAARAGLLIAAVVVCVAGRAVLDAPAGAQRLASGTWDVGAASGYANAAGWMVSAVYLYGLAASLHAFRLAPRGSITRRRAGAYALAFGVQDAGLALGSALDATGRLQAASYFLVYALPALAFLPLLAAALLRFQLFDFELRLKWTLRRGTLVGAFVAAFFVASAIVEQYLEQYGVVAGGVAVGLLLFAVRPLERAADRVANVALPNVRDTEEYRTVRKREVYLAAVESALEDGEVTQKERGVLATLASQLGLDPREAYEIEREARHGS